MLCVGLSSNVDGPSEVHITQRFPNPPNCRWAIFSPFLCKSPPKGMRPATPPVEQKPLSLFMVLIDGAAEDGRAPREERACVKGRGLDLYDVDSNAQ